MCMLTLQGLANTFLSAGLIFEIVGVLLMAHLYLKVENFKEQLKVLISALYRGEDAQAVQVLPDIFKEKKIVTLQGIAFIVLGFIFQFIASILLFIS